MRYTLVPLAQRHLEDAARLERECFSDPWSAAMLAEELDNPVAYFIAAQGEDGALLGYAGLHIAAGEGYIANIAVDPACRRRGVGAALLGDFLELGRRELEFLTLEVRPSNVGAIRFYEAFGFAPVGRRKNYYDAPQEDAILMTLEFNGYAER